jgi:UDP-glucose 4-epimerase
MAILVTGGAGYIGSVAVSDLLARGEEVVVIDSLVYGHRAAVSPDIPFYHGEIGDEKLVAQICREHSVEACLHFSAFAYVGESVAEPRKYFENNVAQTLRLLNVLIDRDIKKFVFSSTCATYGEPQYVPIDEQHPQDPTNPYGLTKLIVEHALETYDKAYGLKYVSLRYFNACGATETLGEDHSPETHLIPLALAAAAGKIPSLSIFGDDYPTPDGTAVRDYIHVSDLSTAHIQALDHLRSGGSSEFINLGNGNGYSVKEVIDCARRITGREINAEVAPRRPGDPARLIANAAKAEKVLGWKPKFADLDSMIGSAWNWHQAHPGGYETDD